MDFAAPTLGGVVKAVLLPHLHTKVCPNVETLFIKTKIVKQMERTNESTNLIEKEYTKLAELMRILQAHIAIFVENTNHVIKSADATVSLTSIFNAQSDHIERNPN